ncbi:MAG: hypothetical protein IPP83_01700 [Flavobacteriales bacterium]|nr:hypothetical protein [Flavobacteriales bacterium]
MNRVSRTTIKHSIRIFAFTAVLLFGYTLEAEAQKMYMWCPDELKATPRTDQLRDVEINLMVTDARIVSEKVRDKCSSQELIDGVVRLIKGAYPAARITVLPEGERRAEEGKVMLEVRITSYHATFTSPSWFAMAGFSVKLVDHRGEQRENSRDISKEKKFFNAGGFATAKNNLNKAYVEACIELLDFISDELER